MDGTVLGLFLVATFVGAVVAGLAGFAMSLVVTGVWLRILTPIQTVTLIVGYGLLVQGYGIWKLRRALSWHKVAPFIAGGAIGVPVGAALLAHINPSHMRMIVGVLLVAYAGYSLARPTVKAMHASVPVDVGVGVLNGLLGGLTGLAGIVVVVWCQLRGLPKDSQRAIFQPVGFAVFAMTAISLAIGGEVAVETAKLYLIGLPLVLAGMWAGFKLYGRVDDAGFRRIVLVLLLASGISLIVPESIFR